MKGLTVLVCLLSVILISLSPRATAQFQVQSGPRVELRPVTALDLPGESDSNSPAVWDHIGGRTVLFVMTSASGKPSSAAGSAMDRLGDARQVTLDQWPGGGVWMEAVVKDVDGMWYGYYHQEVVANMCGTQKVIPRI